MMGEKEILAGAAGPMSEEDPDTMDTYRIRSDIAQTREQIGSTIEALQEKLSPATLAEQAKTAVREATIGKVESMMDDAEHTIARTGHSFFDTVREHPVPATLAGVGLAWLLMSRRRDARHERRTYQRPRGEPGGEEMEYSRSAGEIVSRAGERAADAARGAGEKAVEAARGAGEMVKHAEEKVVSAARSAGGAVVRAARGAGEQGQKLESRLEQVYYDNPLAVGTVVLAAGTALGLAIPISRKENEWMGAARDEVVEKASEMAHEALGKVEDATRPRGSNGGPPSGRVQVQRS